MRVRVLLLLLIVFSKVYAQNEPIYSHYMFNSMSFNPAFAGNYDKLHLQTSYRLQWLGIEGAPRTIMSSIDAPIFNKMSAGLEILQDNIGDFSNTSVYGNYAYRININEASRISLGLGIGIRMQRLGKDNISMLDPIFNNLNYNQNDFNAKAGIHYSNNKFYFSVSSTELLPSSNYINSEVKNKNQSVFISSGYSLKIADEFVFYPSILYRENFKNASYFNFTSLVGYKSTLWLGLSYRQGFYLFNEYTKVNKNDFSKVIGLLFDYELNDLFRVGYNFDFNIANNQSLGNSSHELSLSYFLNSKKSTRMLNPRYL